MVFSESLQPVIKYLEAVQAAAEETGSRVYLVGGSIRHLLSGKTPADLDFVVDEKGHAGKVANAVAPKLEGASKPSEVNELPTIELRHDTYTLQIADPVRGMEDEAASIYADISQALKEDMLRRDFTINTLLMPVQGRSREEIIDPTSIGLVDTQKSRLRTPVEPEYTLTEDPVRMMRAVRFYATEGFEIKADLAAAIMSLAHLIEDEAGERVQAEFSRMLVSKRPSDAIWALKRLALLHFLFPGIEHLADVQQHSEHYKEDILSHTCKVLDETPQMLRLRLAALFHDIGKAKTLKESGGKTIFAGHQHVGSENTRNTLKKLRYSNALIEEVARLVDMHMVTYSKDWSEVAVRRLVNEAGELLDDLMLLYRADIMARTRPYNDLSEFNHLMERIKMLDLDALVDVKCPLPGEEIMSIMMIKAGPEVGEIQAEIEQAIIDGKIDNTLDAAKEYLENELKPRKSSGKGSA